MRSTLYLTASAFAALASAQTFTDCDPTKKDCPNNPAMPATFNTDFKAGAAAVKGWKQTAGSLNYGAAGAEFTISKKGDAPTIQSEAYLHFGYIEVTMKAAPGAGIVSSIVLQSDDLDEVDWEYIGSVPTQAQMNYFGKGNTTTYDRMIPATVSNVVTEMHKYALNWTADSLTWLIDDAPVRTLKYADAVGGKNYPQTPSNIRIGIWAGGDSENQGTRDWAGGPPDYSKAPFTQTVESIKITNYSPGKEYKWSDKSGSWQSIEVIGKGDTAGAPQNSVVIQPSAPAGGSAGGLESVVAAPTGGAGSGYGPDAGSPPPAGESPCSEGTMPSPTPVPAPPAPPATNGSTPGQPPCDCGIATVTVTGYPPEGPTPAPPAAPPASGVPAPSAPVSPPEVTPPASTPLPSFSGIMTETKPAPSVPMPSNPTGGVAPPPPAASGNASGTPEIFPGAASHNTAGALFAVVLGAMVLLI